MRNPDADNPGSLDPRLAAADELMEQGKVSAACNEYMLYAGKCLADGQIPEAIKYYGKIGEHGLLDIEGRLQLAGMYIAVGDDAEAVEVYIKIADDYIAQGLSDKAPEVYEKAIGNIPDSDKLRFKLAELFALSGNSSKALKIYLDVLKENPNNLEVLELLAEIYTNRNSKSEAVDAYLRMAVVYEKDNKLDDLARCYEEILKLSPQNLATLKMTAEIYMKLGEKEQLITALTRLAKLFYEKGQKENALNLYSKILQLDPQNPEALECLGKSIKVISVLPDDDSGEYTELNMESSLDIPVIDVGEIKGEPMDPDVAIKTVGDLLGVELPTRKDAKPENAQIYYDLGIAYLEMGLYDEAVQYLQFSSRDSDFRMRSCNMLGLCFLDRDMAGVAIKEFERALNTPNITEEESVGLYYNLSLAYERAGENRKALDELTRVYAVNIGYLDVKERLERLRKLVDDEKP
jgi:tetratricopeptide (TPR) repeat protein